MQVLLKYCKMYIQLPCRYLRDRVYEKSCPNLGQPSGVLINYVKLFTVKDQFPGGGGSFRVNFHDIHAR